ncbi:MAG: hypothetical protein WCS37_02575 [Chloroflexota bacterium]|nr:hypothetical protein [Chloroflexota bacterium]
MPEAKERQSQPEESWCVVIATENLYVVGTYRERAVAILKLIVPPGARRFYRQAGPEFFVPLHLSPLQVAWLVEAQLFKGAWQVLSDYRRPLIEALTVEYKEVWLVENGQSWRLEQGLLTTMPSLVEKYNLGPVVELNLGWARSFALYCHRHRTFEVDPCSGLFSEAPVPEGSKRKRGDTLLRTPHNTLIRARRQQTSYYLAQEGEVTRLGRDKEGEEATNPVIQGQRLGLVLRAARAITGATA